jgi:hypothetical protein
VRDILRLLVVKVDVAENVTLRYFRRLELIDGIETDRNLSNHRVLELAVYCVDVRIKGLDTLKHLTRKLLICSAVQQVWLAWNLPQKLDILLEDLLFTSHQNRLDVRALNLEVGVVIWIDNQV